jgi:hypothetical protein
MTTTATTTRTHRVSPLRGGLIGAALALVLDLAVFVIANAALAGSIQTARSGEVPTDLPIGAVVAAAVVPVLLGAAVLWLLARFTGSALTIWTTIAAVVTVLSLAAPLTLPVDGGSKLALALMHVLTGASAIVGQRQAARAA